MSYKLYQRADLAVHLCAANQEPGELFDTIQLLTMTKTHKFTHVVVDEYLGVRKYIFRRLQVHLLATY